MIGLITAGGEITSPKVFMEEYNKSDFRIAADSGVEFYLRNGVVPDRVLGDFDSISKEGKSFIKEKKISVSSFPPEKDYTDLELCIDFLIEKGCKNITILGGVGDRMDHSLANLFMMIRFYKAGITIALRNDLMKIQVLEGKLSLKKEYEFLSVVPADPLGIVASLEGFYYPLDNRKIPLGSTLGVSNYIIEEEGHIDIAEGTAYIIQTNERKA